jgi:hypothetical protein
VRVLLRVNAAADRFLAAAGEFATVDAGHSQLADMDPNDSL